MGSRKEIISNFYAQYDEDGRTARSRHGQLEYCTTMTYIHRYATKRSKILEIGAGTGRYSIALAKEGMDVTAVELVESNLAVLRENSKGLERIRSFQGDATDLSRFPDNSFDVTLSLGPMYHLYEADEVNRAIDEAIRVTKPRGVILFAFISVFAIMYANYFYGNWSEGQAENFTKDHRVRHFKEQVFTGYDVTEFEDLFRGKPVEWITTAGVDGLLEPIEKRPDFSVTDKEFQALAEWYLAFSEKRELLGHTNHLLYICRKRAIHTMNLTPAAFSKIKNGTKTIELRLYDEKRKKIRPGDRIVFTETESGEKLEVRVLELSVFDSFAALYAALPLAACGYAEEELDRASPEDMDLYYSKEQQRKYGAVGIRIALP